MVHTEAAIRYKDIFISLSSRRQGEGSQRAVGRGPQKSPSRWWRILLLLLPACGEKVGMRGVAFSSSEWPRPLTRSPSLSSGQSLRAGPVASRPLPARRGEERVRMNTPAIRAGDLFRRVPPSDNDRTQI